MLVKLSVAAVGVFGVYGSGGGSAVKISVFIHPGIRAVAVVAVARIVAGAVSAEVVALFYKVLSCLCFVVARAYDRV